MDARQERGLQLAQRGHITKHANGWQVLSQTGNGSYFVHLEGNPSCTCPDFEIRQQPCKHIHAVECLILWDTITDGGQTVITKTKMGVTLILTIDSLSTFAEGNDFPRQRHRPFIRLAEQRPGAFKPLTLTQRAKRQNRLSARHPPAHP